MTTRDRRVQTVIAYAQEQYAKQICTQTLAKALNLSASRLRHLLKAELGLSLNQYTKSIRLQKAQELLATTWLSIKEIMAVVGYNDPSRFARDFKRTYGASPLHYRLEAPIGKSTSNKSKSADRQSLFD